MYFPLGAEAPEFRKDVLESLRTPLELGAITISRATRHVRYPASFQMVLAANPCPCGHAETPGAHCQCQPARVRAYQQRVSGPLLDRIDIHQRLLPLARSQVQSQLQSAETTQVVAQRVRQARDRQAWRLQGLGWRTNSEIPGSALRTMFPQPEGLEMLDEAVIRGHLSARGVDRCLRLAWTVADLAGKDVPTRTEIRLALALRGGSPGLRGIA